MPELYDYEKDRPQQDYDSFYLRLRRRVEDWSRRHMNDAAAELVLCVPDFFYLLMKLMGAKILFLTNAAGGVNGGVRPGELMVISDHINLTGRNPLEGVAASEIKPVFIDMSDAYDAKLREKFVAEAAKTGVTVHSGVYAQMLGPSYETPAEIRMLGKMGADAVGMSTAVEAIYARYLKMRVFAVSCISNMAAGICAEKLRHEDVLAVLKERQQLFSRLMYGFISSL